MNKCGQLSLIEGVECGPSIRCLRAFNRRETKGFDTLASPAPLYELEPFSERELKVIKNYKS
jgi:hypothetical protein